ncbi:MAG TPA: hypothetical protein VGM27_13535, partial [Acidobacteriaceae bacterium]
CMRCLEDDRRGDQFLRLDWLCAAITICEIHCVPLWLYEEPLGALQCFHDDNGARFTFFTRSHSHYSGRRKDEAVLRALCRFEQALKRALAGEVRTLPGLDSIAFVAVVTDLIWALLQTVARDGTRLAHHFEVEHFPVPPGWRAPYTLRALSGLDIWFRQSVLAIVACLLLPTYFADLITVSSHLGRPDTDARLLDVLGPENVDTLLGRAHRWPIYFRLRMEKAARSRPISRDVKRKSTD